jgi:hypothetical protein
MAISLGWSLTIRLVIVPVRTFKSIEHINQFIQRESHAHRWQDAEKIQDLPSGTANCQTGGNEEGCKAYLLQVGQGYLADVTMLGVAVPLVKDNLTISIRYLWVVLVRNAATCE